jgi:predicted DNA-binding transcriptional regulator AlpA
VTDYADRWLDVDEACIALDASRATLYRLTKARAITSSRIGRRTMWSAKSIVMHQDRAEATRRTAALVNLALQVRQ